MTGRGTPWLKFEGNDPVLRQRLDATPTSHARQVLVTGGAGYIGSHVALALTDAGVPVVIVDDLRAGRQEALIPAAAFEHGSVEDHAFVLNVVNKYRIKSVIHLAGSVSVEESVRTPLDYYQNNVAASACLLKACIEGGVEFFVYSSTAAVYGQPARSPVAEEAQTSPISPYGRSKLAFEWILRDAAASHGMAYAILRYFNVAGADPAGRSGPSQSTETQLIKVATEVALGRRPTLPIFGTDYATRDGTCIRDFIHVSDLARVHLETLDYLWRQNASITMNCGYGRGFSVQEVVRAIEALTGHPLPISERPRRPGDAPEVVADIQRLQGTLDWRPTHDELSVILAHVMSWEQRTTG